MANKPISPIAFSILLALSLRPRHGYELMQQIGHDSGGRITLGPGSLYGTIKSLSGEHLIEELPLDSNRRRYYRLTKKGWDHLGADIAYYEGIVRLGRERHVLNENTGVAWCA